MNPGGLERFGKVGLWPILCGGDKTNPPESMPADLEHPAFHSNILSWWGSKASLLTGWSTSMGYLPEKQAVQ